MPATSNLIPVDEVITRLLARAIPRNDTITVSIDECYRRVLAEDVRAAIDVPPAANSSMDGYAVNTADATLKPDAVLLISERIAAGHVGGPLKPGTVARIFTGAPIPQGANAVVIQEDTEPVGRDNVRIRVVPNPDENVRPQGQDIAAGSVILSAGRMLTPQDAALAASVGLDKLNVFRPLRVAVMSTGDELVDPPGPTGPGQIFNSNHYALIGLVRELGMEPVDIGLVADTAEATEAALKRAAGEADCILSSGGVSVGEEDHVKDALERLGELEIWRIAIKPGKPLAFGRVGDTPFFGLPGNPVSTFVTFTMIAKPYLLKYQGCSEPLPRHVFARAEFEMPAGSRREYVRVRVTPGPQGALLAEIYPNQGSGVMSSVSWANALALVDIGQSVSRGDTLQIFLLNH